MIYSIYTGFNLYQIFDVLVYEVRIVGNSRQKLNGFTGLK